MQHISGTHFDLDWLCLLPLWLTCTIWATVLVQQRGHATWKGLLVGLFLGPVGVLWALTSSRATMRQPQWSVPETVSCRYCQRPVSRYARVCPHCGQDRPAGAPGRQVDT